MSVLFINSTDVEQRGLQLSLAGRQRHLRIGRSKLSFHDLSFIIRMFKTQCHLNSTYCALMTSAMKSPTPSALCPVYNSTPVGCSDLNLNSTQISLWPCSRRRSCTYDRPANDGTVNLSPVHHPSHILVDSRTVLIMSVL